MKKYLFAAYWAILFLYLLYVSVHGLFFPDEGYVLHTGTRMLEGQILYKDFDFVYTPLTAFLNVVAFLLFGQSVLGERLFTLTISLLTCVYLYKLSFKHLKNQVFSMLLTFIYAAFGPGHINFLWPSILSVDLAIISLYFYFEKKWRTFGALAALVFLTKQNLGVGYFLAIFGVFLLDNKQRYAFKHFLKGAITAAGVFLIYFLITNSLANFIDNMYVHTFEQILLNKNLATPLLQGSSILAIAAKTILYASPLWLSVAASYFALKQNRNLLILPFAASAFWLLGIRPVTDYVHLMPLMALTPLPLIVLLRHKGIVYKISATAAILLVLLGIYTSLSFDYYRFKPEILAQNTFVSHPKILVFTDPGTATEINTLSRYVDGNIKKDEEIYLNYYAPMVYFFLDRPNPTRFDYPGVTKELEQELVGSLQDVDYILTHPLNRVETGTTKKFIEQNYAQKEKVYGYEIWKRI